MDPYTATINDVDFEITYELFTWADLPADNRRLRVGSCGELCAWRSAMSISAPRVVMEAAELSQEALPNGSPG